MINPIIPSSGPLAQFVSRHSQKVIGVLQGFDRVRAQTCLRALYHPSVMEYYLLSQKLLFKDFKSHVTKITDRVRQAASDLAERLQRRVIYLQSNCYHKEELARDIQRQDNCFTWIEDMAQAHRLLDQQLAIPWQGLFEPLVDLCHPHHREINAPLKSSYYWTLAETEFATDIMFKNQLALQRIYPALVHHSLMSFGSEQGLRFSSRRNAGDVRSDCRRGPDGVRVKHWFNQNSLKLYDKGSVLRSEMTINKPEDFRVWRGSELNPQAKKWRTLRRTVVDVGRRAEVSRAATHRHLEALAAVHIRTPLAQEAAQFCKAKRRDGRSYRALQPFGKDAPLLQAVNRLEFATSGFANRDIRQLLDTSEVSSKEQRRQSAAIGRKLSLLRAHGLIRKVRGRNLYHATAKGRRVITALLAARNANVEELTKLAA